MVQVQGIYGILVSTSILLSQKTCKTRPHPLLSLPQLASLGLLIQDLEGVSVALLLQVLLNRAELLLELAVQHLVQDASTFVMWKACDSLYLVIENILEVCPRRRTVEVQSTVQLAEL